MLAACLFYHQLHGSWVWFAVLFLTPDLFMLPLSGPLTRLPL